MTAVQTHASGQVLGSGTTLSPIKGIPSVVANTMDIILAVTASSGTGQSLAVSILWSDDGVNFYPASPADAFPAFTAVGGEAMAFTIKGSFYRLQYVVTGTSPSFTVNAAAHFA